MIWLFARWKLILAAVAIAGAGLTGYKAGRWQCGAENAKALEKAAAELTQAQKIANEAARKYLDLKQNPPVKYKEVIREVPKLVDRGECRVTDDGMRKLACVLDPSKCPAKSNAGVPAAPNP